MSSTPTSGVTTRVQLHHLAMILLVFDSVLASVQARENSTSYRREDPLNYFKLYHGGYNVTNIHYWASAAFTGVHGFAVATLWTLCGLVIGIFVILKKCICNNDGSIPTTDPSRCCRLTLFIIVILFTILVITASGFVLAANRMTLQKTERVKDTILSAGEDTRRAMRRVVRTTREMQLLLTPYNLREATRLNITSHRMGKESKLIRQYVQKADRSIDSAVHTLGVMHLVVVAVDLVLLVAATTLLLLHWRRGFVMIIMLCWILTALCWMITGGDFFLHTFAEDTCSAFEDFVLDRQNNSLASILPCLNSTTADNLMFEMRSTIYNMIDQLNTDVAGFYRILKARGWNKTLPAVIVCEPFSGPPDYSYIGLNCTKDEIPIGEVPKILASFTCFNESTQQCERDGKFFSQANYKMASAYSRSTEDLVGIYPDLESLTQCAFIRDTSKDIVWHKCRPFRVSTRMLWSSMLCLSIFMVVLVLTWMATAYLDEGRSFSMCSIFPNSE